MRVVRAIDEMRDARGALAGSVGLVPTMGYLHEGHLSLVRQARADNDHLVVSIFVNPTQFGPSEDFARYPRDEARDLALLQAERADIVFAPTVEEMYPKGYSTYVDVEHITERLEGAHRPGHFRGVATIVTKLFAIVRPARAYFGQKDAQQLAVVRRLARDLALGVEIIGLPTVREADGLALSSRNAYLSPDERQAATVLWRALCRARELFEAGERGAEALRSAMRELIAREPLARVDYVSVADGASLRELERIAGPALVSLAVRIGKTRLIDNITLHPSG
jgi:pantoate--beta-alanine ligase